MLHDVVHSVDSDCSNTVTIHHPSLSCKTESVNAVDVDTVEVGVLLERNFRTDSTELLKFVYLFHVIRALVKMFEIKG